MLIDNKRMAGAATTADGHRRDPESSVCAWIKNREEKSKVANYRAAAKAGIFDSPEQVYVEVENYPGNRMAPYHSLSVNGTTFALLDSVNFAENRPVQ